MQANLKSRSVIPSVLDYSSCAVQHYFAGSGNVSFSCWSTVEDTMTRYKRMKNLRGLDLASDPRLLPILGFVPRYLPRSRTRWRCRPQLRHRKAPTLLIRNRRMVERSKARYSMWRFKSSHILYSEQNSLRYLFGKIFVPGQS